VIAAVPGVHLSLAGNGSLRPRLEALARALGIDGRVDFLGSCADVPTLLGGCDLFVFSTTRAEGLGTVLIEALAAGLPVVASDVPACRELLEEGRWGVLVNPGDPAALALAVIRRLGEPAGEESPGLGAYLESFLPGHMMAAYLEI
jgi:glycosyltransferase involved in cell wall biosynthesis